MTYLAMSKNPLQNSSIQLHMQMITKI